MGFRKMMHKFINWSMREANMGTNKKAYAVIAEGPTGTNLGGSPLNFSVYSAIGGKIIRIQSYDRSTDRDNSTLYIVTDHEDLGNELSQIITRESLTR